MKRVVVAPFVCTLVVCLLLTLPTLATETVQVRFVDAEGEVLLGHTLQVTGSLTAESYRAAPDGIFHLRYSPGDKIELQLGSRNTQFEPVKLNVSPDTTGVLDIAVRPRPTIVLRGTVDPPPNDNCDDAAPAVLNGTVSGTLVGATEDPAAGTMCGDGVSVRSSGVWYTVIGTGNPITATTCHNDGNGQGSAEFDSQISVYCGDCPALTCIGGNDDSANCGGPAFLSTYTWCTQPGAEYKIYVHKFSDATVPGGFVLELVEGTQPCDVTVDCLPEEPVCGDPAAGDCFAANGTPGCNVTDCCELVCGIDPFCCDTAWDGICADEAAEICEPLLAVIGDFTAEVTPRGVQLHWNTLLEIDNAGFNILRRRGHRQMEQVNTQLITARGGALDGASYSFLDSSRQSPGTVEYFLQDVDLWGNTSLHGPVTVELQRPARQGPLENRSGISRSGR